MSITRVLPVVLLSVAVAAPAAARDCPPGYPPANTAIPKDGGGTRDVCDYDPVANRFTCTQTSGSFAQEMTAVSGYDGASADKVSVWGRDGSTGALFCYTRTHTIADLLEVVRLVGASGTDTISLTDGSDYLQQPDTIYIGSSFVLRAQVDGRQGDDVLTGSDETRSQYQETFWGARGDDTIYGNDGDDTIWGCGPTKLCDSADEDFLYGNEGEDLIHCDQNACEARGGDGDDTIFGSDEADTIFGGANNDEICGESGGDTLRGGGGADKIWGGPGADDIEGGPEVDACISPHSFTTCENPLPASPDCGI